MRIKLFAIAALSAILMTPAAHAQANNNIQLLPPTYFGPNNGPCVDSATANNQVLFLGSTGQGNSSAINCLDSSPANPNKKYFVVDPAQGFVGIGTPAPATPLDMTGPVRALDTSTTCSATIAGALRYNSSNNAFEGCVTVSGVYQWLVLGLPACNNGQTIVVRNGAFTCTQGEVVTAYQTTLMSEASYNALIQDYDPTGAFGILNSCNTDADGQPLLSAPNYNAANPGCRNALCVAYFGPIYNSAGNITNNYTGLAVPTNPNAPNQSTIGASCAGPTCIGGSGPDNAQVQINCLYAGQ